MTNYSISIIPGVMCSMRKKISFCLLVGCFYSVLGLLRARFVVFFLLAFLFVLGLGLFVSFSFFCVCCPFLVCSVVFGGPLFLASSCCVRVWSVCITLFLFCVFIVIFMIAFPYL